MKDQRSRAPASVDNIYRLDGRVPVGKAIPFGLQHVLAMFVANVTPVMLIASVAVYNGQAFTAIDTALLIQAAMLIAGIGTLIQLYPVWRIGSRLPVVMGLSFTFLSAMMTLAAKDYGLMIGAVIVGGCIEGVLGLTAKYWRRFVSPIVSACVVTTIGFSLLSTGISSFASSAVYLIALGDDPTEHAGVEMFAKNSVALSGSSALALYNSRSYSLKFIPATKAIALFTFLSRLMKSFHSSRLDNCPDKPARLIAAIFSAASRESPVSATISVETRFRAPFSPSPIK